MTMTIGSRRSQEMKLERRRAALRIALAVACAASLGLAGFAARRLWRAYHPTSGQTRGALPAQLDPGYGMEHR